MTDITGMNTYEPDPLKKGESNKGWFIRLKEAEKVVARPTVFNRILYFTTHIPEEGEDEEKRCPGRGTARLYIVEFLSGGGAVFFSEAHYLANTPSTRSIDIGEGVPSAPLISADTKGRASLIVSTSSEQIYSRVILSEGGNKDILYWREVHP